MTQILSLNDLRPGDMMLGPIGGLVGVGVALGQIAIGEGFRVGRFSVRHAGIVTLPGDWDGMGSGPLLAQAMPSGAEEIELRRDSHWSDSFAYVRIPEDYPGQAQDAAEIARLMVREGVSYSFASYAALAAWKYGVKAERLARWIDRRRPAKTMRLRRDTLGTFSSIALPCEAICSVFNDQAWSLTGKKLVTDTRPQIVTPGWLAGALLSMPGAVWCLPRGDYARTWEVDA